VGTKAEATRPTQAESLGGAVRFEIFRDKSGRFRFRFISPSERVVFTSAGGYESRQEAVDAVESVRRGAGTASIGRRKSSLVDHILSGPAWPDEMYDEVNRRSKEPSRPPVEF